MEFLETIRPFTLIVYYILATFAVILVILDNKKPEKSFAFIFLILLVPVAGIIIYLLSWSESMALAPSIWWISPVSPKT